MIVQLKLKGNRKKRKQLNCRNRRPKEKTKRQVERWSNKRIKIHKGGTNV
jgi:hypothetical protein